MKDETVYFRAKPSEPPRDILSMGRDYFTAPDDDERRKPSDILAELAKRRAIKGDA